MTAAGPTDVAVAECLLSVLRHEVTLDEALSRPLAQIGVESWAFTAFLVRIEKEFGVVWDFDVPADTFDSVESIARYIEGQARA